MQLTLEVNDRIRIGDFRVIYEIEDDILVVVVVSVGDRKEVYL